MMKRRKSNAVASVFAGMIRFLITAYRHSFAYFLGGQCRYTPSCSAFALEAVEKYGPLRGSRLALGRICRCHPWGGHGADPVPENLYHRQ